MEETIQQQDRLGLDRARVQQHGDRAVLVEGVRVERGLDHDEGVADVFVVEDVPVEGRFVGGVVEDLRIEHISIVSEYVTARNESIVHSPAKIDSVSNET